MSHTPPLPPTGAVNHATLRLGPLRCTTDQLTDLMVQWNCTPTECEVLVRLLMLESPKQIASARHRSVDHIRNVVNSIVHKSRSGAGVPGVIMQAAAILMPQEQIATPNEIPSFAEAQDTRAPLADGKRRFSDISRAVASATSSNPSF